MNIKHSEKTALLQFDKSDVCVQEVATKYHGFFKVNEYQLQHKLYNGQQSAIVSREIFERGNAVVIMPYDPVLDQLVLIEQFRPGALQSKESPWLLEFVAGMFNDNERPVDVAIREAKEEANIDINTADIRFVMKYLSSPGGMSECIHLYLAKIDASIVSAGEVFGLDEENEDILLHLVSRVDALALLEQGKITNAATIIGLQWLAMHYQHV